MNHILKPIITSVILSLNSIVLGQSHYVGMKGGVSWCNQTGNLYKNTEVAQRFSAGLNYAYTFSNHLKIGGDLLYAQTGFKFPFVVTDQLGNPLDYEPFFTKSYYDYISVPVKVGYEYGNKGFVYGGVGITTSFLINAKTTVLKFNGGYDDFKIIGSESVDITERVAPIELAAIAEIGLGYTFFEKIGMYVEGNFQQGFTSITNKEYFKGKTIFKYNASVQLGIRYKLK